MEELEKQYRVENMELVELHRLYAAFINPQCHYFLNIEANNGQAIEVGAEALYILWKIEQMLGT